jgi:hypothetical protein
MTTIYRLTDGIIVVDGIHCEKSMDGRYYPIREDLMYVSVFADVIDEYLVEEDKMNQLKFNAELRDILDESKIDYGNV